MKVKRVSYSKEYGATITLEAETVEDVTILRLFFDSEIEASSITSDKQRIGNLEMEISTKYEMIVKLRGEERHVKAGE